MVRIKIDANSKTDVTDMRAKGWHILVFRGQTPDADFVTAEKKDVRFVMKITNNNDAKCVEITKYLDGYVKDVKKFYEGGCYLNGTLCISEGKEVEQTYAFFRNEKLQQIIDEFGLRRIVFPREDGDTFSKTVWTKEDKQSRSVPTPAFHTDGAYEDQGVEDETRKWLVTGASYIYEYTSGTLTIPQQYDAEKIREILTSLTD